MTGIQWTNRTWNPVIGCTPVSPGCLNCYAATMARRLEAMGRPEYAPREGPGDERRVSQIQREDVVGYVEATRRKEPQTIRIAEVRGVRGGRAVFTGDVRCLEDRLADPLSWRKPAHVFVCSMSDLFHASVPFEFIDRVFAVMALSHLTFQVLTKRPERMREYLTRDDGEAVYDAAIDAIEGRCDKVCGRLDGFAWPLPNVWIGTSVEDQARADERIPHLLACPVAATAVRFLSCEPLLGPLDLRKSLDRAHLEPDPGRPIDWIVGGIGWVIVGGESGARAKIRPTDIDHVRSVVTQCRAAGVPVFVKQVGAWPVDASHGEPAPMPFTHDDGDEHVARWYRPRDRAGGDPDEWPTDLRVREMPGMNHRDASSASLR